MAFDSAAGVTLDAGALIAIDKGNQKMKDDLTRLYQRGRKITVPAPVLAQVWRGSHPRLAMVLRTCVVEDMSEATALDIGLLLAQTRTTDIVDAAMVEGAARRGDVIMTSDPDDIERLVESCGRKLRVVTV